MTPTASRRLRVNSSALLSGQLARLALQGTYFVIAARTLGVAQFGAFAGLLALVSVVAPFAPLGATNLLIRNVSREPHTAGGELRRALVVTSIGATLMTALLLLLAPYLAPEGTVWKVVLLLAISELLASKLVDASTAVFVASEAMFRAAAYPVVLAAVRLGAAGALAGLGSSVGLTQWALAYALATVSVALPVVLVTLHRIGPGRLHMSRLRSEWKQGLLFSFSLASQTVYNDVDKAMLARLSTLDATGIYSVAYRAVDFAFAPMRALLAATYPRFFRAGRGGVKESARFGRRMLVPSLAINLTASLGLLALSPLLPIVLGANYDASVSVIQALCVLPVIRGFHYLAADTLTGADRQGLRSCIQGAMAVLNVALNLVLIPVYGYWGATASSILCDGALAVAMIVAVRQLVRRPS